MDKAPQTPHTHLFTVRLWLEELGEEQTEWRGEVQYVVSGEVRYFRDWTMLIATLQAMLPTREGLGAKAQAVHPSSSVEPSGEPIDST